MKVFTLKCQISGLYAVLLLYFICCEEPGIHTDIPSSKVDYLADSFQWPFMSVFLWLPTFGAFDCLITLYHKSKGKG